MTSGNLLEIVDSLSPQQQDAVRAFIDYLTATPQPESSSFLNAVDEFIAEHPTLLHNLAQ
jgi:hypothetical protein